jgi:hypothetical protein
MLIAAGRRVQVEEVMSARRIVQGGRGSLL